MQDPVRASPLSSRNPPLFQVDTATTEQPNSEKMPQSPSHNKSTAPSPSIPTKPKNGWSLARFFTGSREKKSTMDLLTGKTTVKSNIKSKDAPTLPNLAILQSIIAQNGPIWTCKWNHAGTLLATAGGLQTSFERLGVITIWAAMGSSFADQLYLRHLRYYTALQQASARTAACTQHRHSTETPDTTTHAGHQSTFFRTNSTTNPYPSTAQSTTTNSTGYPTSTASSGGKGDGKHTTTSLPGFVDDTLSIDSSDDSSSNMSLPLYEQLKRLYAQNPRTLLDACTSANGRAIVYPIPYKVLLHHQDDVTNIDWSSSNFLISAGLDTTCYMWYIPDTIDCFDDLSLHQPPINHYHPSQQPEITPFTQHSVFPQSNNPLNHSSYHATSPIPPYPSSFTPSMPATTTTSAATTKFPMPSSTPLSDHGVAPLPTVLSCSSLNVVPSPGPIALPVALSSAAPPPDQFHSSRRSSPSPFPSPSPSQQPQQPYTPDNNHLPLTGTPSLQSDLPSLQGSYAPPSTEFLSLASPPSTSSPYVQSPPQLQQLPLQQNHSQPSSSSSSALSPYHRPSPAGPAPPLPSSARPPRRSSPVRPIELTPPPSSSSVPSPQPPLQPPSDPSILTTWSPESGSVTNPSDPQWNSFLATYYSHRGEAPEQQPTTITTTTTTTSGPERPETHYPLASTQTASTPSIAKSKSPPPPIVPPQVPIYPIEFNTSPNAYADFLNTTNQPYTFIDIHPDIQALVHPHLHLLADQLYTSQELFEIVYQDHFLDYVQAFPHQQIITACLFYATNEQYVLTCCFDLHVRIWDVLSGRCLHSVYVPLLITTAAFCPVLKIPVLEQTQTQAKIRPEHSSSEPSQQRHAVKSTPAADNAGGGANPTSSTDDDDGSVITTQLHYIPKFTGEVCFGHYNGKISLFNLSTLHCEETVTVRNAQGTYSAGERVSGLQYNETGTILLVTTTDNRVRLLYRDIKCSLVIQNPTGSSLPQHHVSTETFSAAADPSNSLMEYSSVSGTRPNSVAAAAAAAAMQTYDSFGNPLAHTSRHSIQPHYINHDDTTTIPPHRPSISSHSSDRQQVSSRSDPVGSISAPQTSTSHDTSQFPLSSLPFLPPALSRDEKGLLTWKGKSAQVLPVPLFQISHLFDSISYCVVNPVIEIYARGTIAETPPLTFITPNSSNNISGFSSSSSATPAPSSSISQTSRMTSSHTTSYTTEQSTAITTGTTATSAAAAGSTPTAPLYSVDVEVGSFTQVRKYKGFVNSTFFTFASFSPDYQFICIGSEDGLTFVFPVDFFIDTVRAEVIVPCGLLSVSTPAATTAAISSSLVNLPMIDVDTMKENYTAMETTPTTPTTPTSNFPFSAGGGGAGGGAQFGRGAIISSTTLVSHSSPYNWIPALFQSAAAQQGAYLHDMQRVWGHSARSSSNKQQFPLLLSTTVVTSQNGASEKAGGNTVTPSSSRKLSLFSTKKSSSSSSMTAAALSTGRFGMGTHATNMLAPLLPSQLIPPLLPLVVSTYHNTNLTEIHSDEWLRFRVICPESQELLGRSTMLMTMHSQKTHQISQQQQQQQQPSQQQQQPKNNTHEQSIADVTTSPQSTLSALPQPTIHTTVQTTPAASTADASYPHEDEQMETAELQSRDKKQHLSLLSRMKHSVLKPFSHKSKSSNTESTTLAGGAPLESSRVTTPVSTSTLVTTPQQPHPIESVTHSTTQRPSRLVQVVPGSVSQTNENLKSTPSLSSSTTPSLPTKSQHIDQPTSVSTPLTSATVTPNQHTTLTNNNNNNTNNNNTGNNTLSKNTDVGTDENDLPRGAETTLSCAQFLPLSTTLLSGADLRQTTMLFFVTDLQGNLYFFENTATPDTSGNTNNNDKSKPST